MPRLSVVVPVRGDGAHLAGQLEALCAQQVDQPWEIVVADNGLRGERPAGVDVRGVDVRGVDVRWVDATARRGAAAARNLGAAQATGEWLMFCDADDLVLPGWLTALAAALGAADLAAGPFDFGRLDGGAARVAYASLEQQFGYLPAGLGANLAVRAELFARLGGFDEALPAGEDIDLCWRAQQQGARFTYAAGAVVAKRERPNSRALARQAYRYGRGDVALFVRHRSRGMPRELRLAVRTWGWLALHAPGAIASGRTRALWIRSAALRTGRLVGSAKARTLLP